MEKNKPNPIAEVFSYAHDKKLIGLSVFLAVIAVLSGLLPYFAASYLVIGLINKTLTINLVLLWGILAIGGYLLKTICLTISSVCSHKMGYAVMAEIRTMLTQKLLRLSMGKATQRNAGEYKEILMDEVEHLEYPLAHMLPELTSHILGFIVIVIYMFTVSWQLALASLGTLVLGFLIYGMMMAGKDVMGMFQKYTKDSETMAGTMVEYVNGMEVIKAFGRTASSMEKFSSAVKAFRDSMIAWFNHCHPFLAGFYVVTPNSLMLVLPIGILLLAAGSITLEHFILCMFLAFGVAQPLIKIMEFADHIMAITTTMGKVDEIMGMEELPQGVSALPGADVLNMSHVSFGYGDTEVLHDVSFEVHKGQKVAFVGPSGSGKSTIAKLLVRFYDPDAGGIQINGIDIRNVPLDDLMSNISFVTQDNFLFDTSIKENIRMGNITATDEDVINAAKQAGCHEFIASLSEGYETAAGNAGNKLSGGQKQRIAIARAILKDAPIVILDEASAFMDPENEDRVQKSIEALTEKKTLIMIAHRLHTVIHCDCIFVVDDGHIIACGTHDELLKNCMVYQTLWEKNQEEGVSV